MTDDNSKSPFGRQSRSSQSEYTLPPEPNQQKPVWQRAMHDDGANDRSHVEQATQHVLKSDNDPEQAKRSDKARGTMVRFFNFILTLALVGAIGFVGALWYGKTEFEAIGPLAQEDTFVVPSGATFASIIPGLEKKNIIARQGPLRVFLRGVRAAGKSSALKAGEFAFVPGMSMRDVMMQLTEGRSIQYGLTFPEGWTSLRIMERIAANDVLVGDPPPIPPEGALLPNTYNFQRGTTRAALVQTLRDAQQKAVREVWNNRAAGLPLKSPQELVVLASIIEKETGVASERKRVASVFINRLRKGMKLQTDPTVIYGIWGGAGKPKDRGGLRRSELDKSTPYNTYIIKGLPPGPIANPGIESLRAAANPIETEDIFFVADGTGGHVFAKTLAEHNANVRNWRAVEAERKKAAEEAAKKSDTSSESGSN